MNEGNDKNERKKEKQNESAFSTNANTQWYKLSVERKDRWVEEKKKNRWTD